MRLNNQTFILFTLNKMEEDNHIWEGTSNERGWYYDEWYDQTEEKSDLFEVLDRKKKEVNIDNIYNELSDE